MNEQKKRKMIIKRWALILFAVLLMTGCSIEVKKSQVSKYHFHGMSFVVSEEFDVEEDDRRMVIESDDWKMTFITGKVSGQDASMSPWQAFVMVSKETHSDFEKTVFCNQEAVQFTDEDVGLCIYTYIQNPNNPELLAVRLYDYLGDHLELKKNKNVSKILLSCTFEK